MPKADVGILTVIPAELKAVRAALGTDAKEKDAEGTTFWRCSLASQALGRPLAVVAGCVGDAGNYSAATATTRMIAQYKPRIVFLVGIAAGIRGKVKIGEVVLAERIVAYEHAAAVVDQHGNSTLQRRPEIHRIPHRVKQDLVGYLADSPPPDRLQRIFAAIGGTFPTPPPGEAEAYARDVVDRIEAPSEGTVASGEKLLRDPSVLLRVRENVHGKTEVGEMEAAGFVEACRPGDVQWLVVRGISDFGDSLKNDAFHELAARAAAAVLVDFLTHGLELDLPRAAPPAATTVAIDSAATEPALRIIPPRRPPRRVRWTLLAVPVIGLAAAIPWAFTPPTAVCDESSPIEICEQDCQAADAAACFQVAERFGQDKDPVPTTKMYAKSCELGYATACSRLAQRYASGLGTAKDDTEANRLFERACDLNAPGSCYDLAIRYEHGTGAKPDDVAALRLYRKGCDLYEAASCVNLGYRYSLGKGVEEDDVTANELLRKGCYLGSPHGCVSLGFQYDMGAGVAEDDTTANKLYRVACFVGAPSGCYYLGLQYDHGEGVSKDSLAANRLYKQACDAGDAFGCSSLGYQYEQGLGVPKNLAEAKRVYKLACDAGHPRACASLGRVYAAGDGKDDTEANSLFSKACDADYAYGCFYLGMQYAGGAGVAKDPVAATRLYRRACDMNYAYGCFYLGTQYSTGDGVVKNEKEATRLHRKACKMDRKLASPVCDAFRTSVPR